VRFPHGREHPPRGARAPRGDERAADPRCGASRGGGPM